MLGGVQGVTIMQGSRVYKKKLSERRRDDKYKSTSKKKTADVQTAQ